MIPTWSSGPRITGVELRLTDRDTEGVHLLTVSARITGVALRGPHADATEGAISLGSLQCVPANAADDKEP